MFYAICEWLNHAKFYFGKPLSTDWSFLLVFFKSHARFCDITLFGKNIHFLVYIVTHCSLETSIISMLSLALRLVHTCEPNSLQPNMCMRGWDCEHALCYLRMVHIPFATNQNLLVFCTNTNGIGCTMCPVFASGLRKINLPRAWHKLFVNHSQTAWFTCVYQLLYFFIAKSRMRQIPFLLHLLCFQMLNAPPVFLSTSSCTSHSPKGCTWLFSQNKL